MPCLNFCNLFFIAILIFYGSKRFLRSSWGGNLNYGTDVYNLKKPSQGWGLFIGYVHFGPSARVFCAALDSIEESKTNSITAISMGQKDAIAFKATKSQPVRKEPEVQVQTLTFISYLHVLDIAAFCPTERHLVLNGPTSHPLIMQVWNEIALHLQCFLVEHFSLDLTIDHQNVSS